MAPPLSRSEKKPPHETTSPSRTALYGAPRAGRPVVHRLSPLGDPIQAEWVATILLRENRASGCFGEARKTRCKTRHEKGNVTRMLGGRSRKLLKEWLLRLDS